MDVRALGFGELRDGGPHAVRERLDEAVGVEVRVDVLDGDLAAVEVEPGADLGLVLGDGHRREVRCEHDRDRPLDAVVEHLPDGLLDPRGPVAHAEVGAEAARGCGVKVRHRARDLLLGQPEDGRRAADLAVVVRDLVEHGPRRRPPVADVGEVARQVAERLGAAVGHEQDADGSVRHGSGPQPRSARGRSR